MLGVGLAAMWLGSYLGTSSILMRAFLELERQEAREDVSRALRALEADLAVLSGAAGDWAAREDLHEFIEGRNPSFERKNVEPHTTYIQFRLNLIMLVDRSGRRVLTRVFDQSAKRFPAPTPVILDLANPAMGLANHSSRHSVIQGIVALPNGAMLLASRPILTRDSAGPRGALIFGRYLSQAEIGRLSAQVRLKLDVFPAALRDLPPDLAAAREALSEGTGTVVLPQDERILNGYARINDIRGRPALILRVEMPRSIYAQGRSASSFFVLALTVLGLLLGVVLVWTFERLVLSRFSERRAEKRYHKVVEQTSDGILLANAESGEIIEGNRACEQILGYGGHGLRGLSLTSVLPDLRPVLDEIRTSTGPERRGAVEAVRYRRPDDRELDLEVSADGITTDGALLFVLSLRDVTERKDAERALRTSEERYALAAQGANDGLWDWNLNALHFYYSPRWKAMLGLEQGTVGETIERWLDRVHPDDKVQLSQALARHLDGETPHFESEFRIRHEDGSYRWFLARGLAVRDATGFAQRLAGSMTDITARKKAEEQLLHDAFHDALTDLPNRELFADRLGQAMARIKRDANRQFAVLFIDLDRFKLVNDSFGHGTGDELLIAVGERLKHAVREGDTVARLGGDEFAVLLDEVNGGHNDVRIVVERIRAELKVPFEIGGRQTFMNASIGSVLVDHSAARAEDVLRDADTALYRAKATGRNRHVSFDPSMHDRVVELLMVENDLRRALELDELFLQYQPIFRMDTGAIEGFEALVRWRHPKRGVLLPTEFIPLAEETGLILAIGRWVLERVCLQIKEWMHRYGPDLPFWVSVNLSPKQFVQPTLADDIIAALGAHGIPPKTLKLEITEGSVMEDLERSCALLARLRGFGVGVALDDFGVGYSSLGVLNRLPIDTLKVDQIFISRMSTASDDADSTIVQSIASMARSLHMVVVAEGLEEKELAKPLQALGCDYAQGFAFAKPLSAADATGLLDDRTSVDQTSPGVGAPDPVQGLREQVRGTR